MQTGHAASTWLMVVLVLIGLSSCSWTDQGGLPEHPRVVLVGDSVTFLSIPEIRRDFDRAFATPELTIAARPGLRTGELLAPARAAMDGHRFDAGVFLVGYNDVLQRTVDSQALAPMLDLADRLPCSVVLLVPTHGGYVGAAARTWNRRIRAEAERRDNVHVVAAWQELVDRTNPFTLTKRVDAVHPNGAGAEVLAKVMADAVTDQCG